MKITALRLYNVKRFAERGVAIEGIGDGVNVLSAANEHGKSTCFEALHALFFQPHTGTPGPVQLLKPYSGGSPLIEADIVTEGGRYRLTKRYYSGKRAGVVDLGTGRLIAQADEAEAFIDGLIGGGTSGPAGLLWVRQGITGLEKRSKGDEESEKRVRQSLLSSVQGEVEAMTGGRRMADIAARCEADLDLLVTSTIRAKAGGQYALAIKLRDDLRGEEERYGKEVRSLREALDTRRLAAARLKELEDPTEVAALDTAVDAAEQALEAAKSHHGALKIAEAELEAANALVERAATEFAAFKGARVQHADLTRKLAEATQKRDDSRIRRSEITAEVEQAAEEVQAAEDDERQCRDRLDRLEASRRAREAVEQATVLRDRLTQAEAARANLEEGEAALALLDVPEGLVEELEALEIKIAGLREAQSANLPSLRIDYQDGAEDSVAVEGQPLADGEERTFAGALKLDLSGIGILRLRSGQPHELAGKVQKAEAERQRLLAALSTDSVASARKRLAAAATKRGEVDLARQRLGDLAPDGVLQLRDEIARLTAVGPVDADVEADAAGAKTDHIAASARVITARNALREMRPLQDKANEAAVLAETVLAGIGADLARLDAALGPADSWAERERVLEKSSVDASTRKVSAENAAAPLRDRQIDLAGAEAGLKRTRSARDAAEGEASRSREVLADLNGQIRTRSEDAVEELWRETAESLEAAEQRVGRFEAEVAVLGRLRNALGDARSASRDLYLKPVITELHPLLRLLFDDISITFDEATLQPQSIRRSGLDEDVDRLSGGMREQLSVLTRLAFARLLARDGRSAPVILDDALVYSDDDRIEKMFDALHRQATDQQIIVFSCRQRAFAKLGGNLLQMKEWTPVQ